MVRLPSAHLTVVPDQPSFSRCVIVPAGRNGLRFDEGRNMMRRHKTRKTIMPFKYRGGSRLSVRKCFCVRGSGRPCPTGAAAAPFARLLRDRNWPHGGQFIIRQGEDMGSAIIIEVVGQGGRSSVRVSG